ncbi:hypothetical protein GCM10011586_30880 [Silvibacterium dinghuense]|nr:hypothetical protein GCM10011586_30880 [Silvibacterium dinghuense]
MRHALLLALSERRWWWHGEGWPRAAEQGAHEINDKHNEADGDENQDEREFDDILAHLSWLVL